MVGESSSFACPTCGARQEPALECRRCKTDLRLLVAVRHQMEHTERICLKQLEHGRLEEALRWAQSRIQLSPDETARRLLTVILLQLGDHQAALTVAGASKT